MLGWCIQDFQPTPGQVSPGFSQQVLRWAGPSHSGGGAFPTQGSSSLAWLDDLPIYVVDTNVSWHESCPCKVYDWCDLSPLVVSWFQMWAIVRDWVTLAWLVMLAKLFSGEEHLRVHESNSRQWIGRLFHVVSHGASHVTSVTSAPLVVPFCGLVFVVLGWFCWFCFLGSFSWLLFDLVLAGTWPQLSWAMRHWRKKCSFRSVAGLVSKTSNTCSPKC